MTLRRLRGGSKHMPRWKDKVNDPRRIPHANGFVWKILYDDGPSEVIVHFDDGLVTYDYEDFRNRWSDHYGGCFLLANHPTAVASGAKDEDT